MQTNCQLRLDYGAYRPGWNMTFHLHPPLLNWCQMGVNLKRKDRSSFQHLWNTTTLRGWCVLVFMDKRILISSCTRTIPLCVHVGCVFHIFPFSIFSSSFTCDVVRISFPRRKAWFSLSLLECLSKCDSSVSGRWNFDEPERNSWSPQWFKWPCRLF